MDPSSRSGRDAEHQAPAAALGAVRHLARHSALLVSTGAFAYIGAFALNVLLARVLGKGGFGSWVVAFSMAQLISVLGLLGGDWIVLRQGAYYHGLGDTERLRRTFHFALLLCAGGLLALSSLLFGLSSLLGRRVFHDPSITPLIRLTCLIAPLIGIRQVMVYGTQAFKDMRDAALNRNILQPAFRLVSTAVALLIVPSQFSAYVGLLAAEILLAAAATYALNRRLPLFGPTAPIERASLLKFAAPVWATRLIETARSQLFPVLIGSLAAVSTSAVFVASRRIAVAPVSIMATINQVYSPIGSDLFLRQRMEELAELFKSIAKWSFTLGFPLFCLMVAFPKDILSIFGDGFSNGSGTLVVLAIGVLFQFGTGPVTTTLILIGRPRLAMLDYVAVAATEIGLAVWLIPSHGLFGAAIAVTAGTALNNVLPLAQNWFILRVHPYRLDFWKPLAAGLVAAGVARLVIAVIGVRSGVLAAAVAAVVVGVVYLSLLLALGLNEQDRAVVQALRLKAGRVADGAGPFEPELGPRS